MQIQKNISLRPYNTFSIEAKAKAFISVTALDVLQEGLNYYHVAATSDLLVLGGGSNLLLTRDFGGIVLHNVLKGISVVHEDDDKVLLKAMAGESWHGLVLHCIAKGFAGIENLALIPGSVGASPMQNIGAYGVEIKDVFHSLEAVSIDDGSLHIFDNASCQFGYRDSIFKNEHKGRFVIISVTYALNKKPLFNTSYGAITEQLEKNGVKELSIKAIAHAVMDIRRSKLPDPAIIPNAGSFFKNPRITKEIFKRLQKEFPDIPGYEAPDSVKLAAAWLIEQCGWKGYRAGDAGCHVHQPLVLVNYGNASGKEVLQLSIEIIESVKAKFDITLEREVNLI